MPECFIVFYDREGSEGKISLCHVFSDIECMKRDVDLFYEAFPSGRAFSFPFFVYDESICKSIDYYLENINEQL